MPVVDLYINYSANNPEQVAPLAPLPEQVVAPQPQPGVRLPRLLPPLPPPMVVADENEEEVSHLSPLFIYLFCNILGFLWSVQGK